MPNPTTAEQKPQAVSAPLSPAPLRRSPDWWAAEKGVAAPMLAAARVKAAWEATTLLSEAEFDGALVATSSIAITPGPHPAK